MFLFVGFLIGLNLMVRVSLGEVRELQSRGHPEGGTRRVTLREAGGIAVKGGIFLVVPVALGYLLDVWFGTTVGELFG